MSQAADNSLSRRVAAAKELFADSAEVRALRKMLLDCTMRAGTNASEVRCVSPAPPPLPPSHTN